MRIALIIVLIIVYTGMAAACGGKRAAQASDPTETSTTTASPSTAVSASATPSLRTTALPAGVATTGANVRPGEAPPVIDPLGLTNTPEGAEHFAMYWEQALDWAYATMDTKLARSLVSPACVTCENVLAGIDESRSRGEQMVGGRSRVLREMRARSDGRRGATDAVAIDLTFKGLVVRKPDGQAVESDPALSSVVFQSWLVWQPIGWSIVDWGHAEP